jgi:hypothetical protein
MNALFGAKCKKLGNGQHYWRKYPQLFLTLVYQDNCLSADGYISSPFLPAFDSSPMMPLRPLFS